MTSDLGLFLSLDFGNTFESLVGSTPISAVAFHPDSKNLLFGFRQLASYDLDTKQLTPITTLSIADNDAIRYIAINPVRQNEIALATVKLHLYISKDSGKTWRQIAENGTTK